ncbi:MAG: hypothetical protein HQ523_16600 [Lentisphaerae bacterium]|nr:hypothetical protein [Lentisphaerota bacterium]
MNKKMSYALVLLALSVLVLLFNTGKGEINLVFDTVRIMKALVYMAFMGVGVVIGLLLK